MKKSLIFLTLLLFLFSGFNISCKGDSTKTALAVTESAAVVAGSFLVQENPEVAIPALDFYTKLEQDDITYKDLNRGVLWLADNDVNPIVIQQILILADEIGAEVDFKNGKFVAIGKVEPKFLNAAIEGFFMGIRLSQANSNQVE